LLKLLWHNVETVPSYFGRLLPVAEKGMQLVEKVVSDESVDGKVKLRGATSGHL